MGQAPDYQSFPLVSGDEVVLEFTVRDNDAAVVNITGGSFRFAAARTERSSLVIDSSASPATATCTITDGANGRVDVTITDEDSEALLGDYYYELKFTDVSGREGVVARGWLSFARNLI